MENYLKSLYALVDDVVRGYNGTGTYGRRRHRSLYGDFVTISFVADSIADGISVSADLKKLLGSNCRYAVVRESMTQNRINAINYIAEIGIPKGVK